MNPENVSIGACVGSVIVWVTVSLSPIKLPGSPSPSSDQSTFGVFCFGTYQIGVQSVMVCSPDAELG
jgi:hypothetical protein